MQDTTKLKIQEKALNYAAEIYKFSLQLPKDEKYNLISQIKRAVISIPLNISEGAASNTPKEFAQSLSYAYRSTKEVLTCFELIERLKLVKEKSDRIGLLKGMGEELCKMIYSFKKSLDT